MTAFILMLLPVTSYAYIKNAKEPSEVGKSTAELNGYTQEQWDRLADNRLEYREIRELIHLFNPDMDNGWNQIDDNARDMQQTVFVLNDAKQKTQDMYDDSLRQIKLLPPAYQEFGKHNLLGLFHFEHKKENRSPLPLLSILFCFLSQNQKICHKNHLQKDLLFCLFCH